jgi:acyl phosphate:glycerol-3-phosphate acyltransferase
VNTVWLAPFAAYFLGSIPVGYLIVRLRGGADVRAAGSGNIGATNVGRVAGAAPGALTLLLDCAKGYLAVWLAIEWSDGNIRWMMLAAVAVVLGHMFPVWLEFRGGKGIATGVGAMLPICAPAILVAIAVWLLVVVFWRYVSLGSIAAAAVMPPLIYLLYAPGAAPPHAVSLGAVIIGVLVIVRHRPNIIRILAGTENRLNFRRKNKHEPPR